MYSITIKNKIMLKNILKLNGVQQLSKSEQKEVNGAGGYNNGLCSCKVGNYEIEGTKCRPNPHCQPV
jgi:hypothetical protein